MSSASTSKLWINSWSQEEAYRIIRGDVIITRTELGHKLIGNLIVGCDALPLDLLANLHGEMPEPFTIFLSLPTPLSGEPVKQ